MTRSIHDFNVGDRVLIIAGCGEGKKGTIEQFDYSDRDMEVRLSSGGTWWKYPCDVLLTNTCLGDRVLEGTL